MGKIKPPPVIRVRSGEAVITKRQQILQQWEEILKCEKDGVAILGFDEVEKKPKICECCGAPFNGDKCDYCGVEYK